MIPPKRFSLLKSSTDRFFSFTRDNFRAVATHSLRNTDLLDQDPATKRRLTKCLCGKSRNQKRFVRVFYLAGEDDLGVIVIYVFLPFRNIFIR